MRHFPVLISIMILSSCAALGASVDSMRKNASDLLIRGDYFSAKKGYEELLLKDTESAPEYLYNHAFCLWKLEKYDEAISELNEIIDKYPDSEYADHSTSLILYVRAEKKNKDIYIIKELTEYLEHNPEGRAVDLIQYLIGGLYLLSLDYEKAREAFNKVIEDYPDSKYLIEAKYGVGRSYFEEKDYEKAKNHFEDFIKEYQGQDPDFASDAKTYLRMIEEIISKNTERTN